MTDNLQVDFDGLPREQLEAMLAAGETVVECQRVLSRTGDNVVGELLRDSSTFYEWTHYPEGDVFDPHSNAQYYYHAHPKDERPGEHGHFHTFLRPQGMPTGAEPVPLPDYEAPKGDNDALSHLIAISCDKMGEPVKLFTTNRWVTGETWYRAADVVRMVDRFVIDHVRPSWATNLWLSSMFVLFRPQIDALVLARDPAVDAWAAAHGSDNVYEDRALEVVGECPIVVSDQISAVRAALAKP